MHSWFGQSHLQGQCTDTAGISLEGGISLQGPKSMKVLGNFARAATQTEMGVRSLVACSAIRPFSSSEHEASHSNLWWETTDQNYPQEAVNGPSPDKVCNVRDLCSPACGEIWVCYMLGLSMVKFQFDLFQNIFLNAICQDWSIGLGFWATCFFRC